MPNERVLRTLARLRNLATSEEATSGERVAANKAFQRLLHRYELTEADLQDEPREEVDIILIARTEMDKALLMSIGWCLELQVYYVYTTRRGKRKRLKKLLLRGDPLVIDLVSPLYLAHRKRFTKRINSYAWGLAAKMFPYKSIEKEDDKPRKPLSSEERQSMLAGYESGERVPVRALEER